MEITEIETEEDLIKYYEEINFKPKNGISPIDMFELSEDDVSKIVKKFNLPIPKNQYHKYETLTHIFNYAPATVPKRWAIFIDVRYNGLLSKDDNNSKFCINCGKKVGLNDNFCIYCGTKL